MLAIVGKHHQWKKLTVHAGISRRFFRGSVGLRRDGIAADPLDQQESLPREEIEMKGEAIVMDDDDGFDSPEETDPQRMELIERLHKPCPGTMPKPKALVYAIDRYLDDLPYARKQVRADAQSVYGRNQQPVEEPRTKSDNQAAKLREALSKRKVLQYGPREAAAYAASQMVAQHGIAHRVLTEVKKRLPDFQPTSMLDFGCGPGTMFWAAYPLWRESLEKMRGIDLSEDMISLGEKLMEYGMDRPEHVPMTPDREKVQFMQYLPMHSKNVSCDLAVSSYALHELPSDPIRAMILRTLWARTKDVMVLIEPGNQEGFRNILNARHYLLALAKSEQQEVHCVAPCAHERACPLLHSDRFQCTFRAQVSHDALVQRSVNGGGSGPPSHPYRNFSYLVLRKKQRPSPAPPPSATKDQLLDEDPLLAANRWPRVLMNVSKRRGQVLIPVCSEEGTIKRLTITKTADKQWYKLARKIEWGDLWPGSRDREHDVKV